MRPCATGAALLALVLGACSEDRRVSPAGDLVGGRPDAAVVDGVDAGPRVDGGGGTACDLTGRWIVAQVTYSTALGATQTTVNWFFHDIVQTGDTFVVEDSLNCGLRVTGTTTVTLRDGTLEALARNTSLSVGRGGSFTPTEDGRCKLVLERTYNVHGGLLGPLLTDHWQPGDPPAPLADFPPLPRDAAEGMADWDADGKEGITLVSGLGDRYVVQRDWNEHQGVVEAGASEFGGDGVIVVTWDAQEVVSKQTPILLQTQSTPVNPGYAYYKRVDDALTVVTSGAHPELETCKNVQRLALEAFPNP
jgi:hypothetical protein